MFLIVFVYKRKLANLFAIFALLAGLVRRFGYPENSPQYFSRALYNENYLGLPYMGICLMVGAGNIILYIPLVLHAFIESGPTV